MRVRSLVPPRHEIESVLGVIVFAIHTWSVRGFLYNLPSFLLKYAAGEILAIFSYHMAFAFFESLCVTVALLVMSALLPPVFLRTGFVYKGTLLVLAASAASIFVQYSFYYGTFALEGAGRTAFLAKALAVVIVLAIGYVWTLRTNGLQRLLSRLAEATRIMPFIYLPIDAASVVVVLVRLLR